MLRKITIAERYRPFSHRPGIAMPLPFSKWAVEIYPAELRFFSLEGKESFLFEIPLKSPPSKFTATCDLERGGIKVELQSSESILRYWIFEQNGPLIYIEKGEMLAQSDRVKVTKEFNKPSYFQSERLSFGITKKQDWDLVKRRNLLKEIVPIWFRLSLFSLQKEVQGEEAPLSESELQNQFCYKHSGLLIPDPLLPKLMGLSDNKRENTVTSKSIRSLFFREPVPGQLDILPHLLPIFPEGRFTGIRFSLGTLDLEWAKGRLRKMVIYAEKSGRVELKLPRKEMSYRLLSSGEPSLDFQAGCEYFLDQFLCQ